MKRLLAGVVLALGLMVQGAMAAPTFPSLTGRVVDQANILSPTVEASLSSKLAVLEAQSGRQLVVTTLSSLQDYDIADYGYQLGRAWGIGSAESNDGALFIIAPNERKVRIEVGYGLEPVLTDALSSVILQTNVLPRFKAGDVEGGVVAGTDAIITQLQLPPDQARAVVAQAEEAQQQGGDSGPGIIPIIIFVVIMLMIMRGGRRRRNSILPWIVLGGLEGMRGGRGGSSWGGGGGSSWGGGGGFSGGGGSFGGGGSSGSW